MVILEETAYSSYCLSNVWECMGVGTTTSTSSSCCQEEEEEVKEWKKEETSNYRNPLADKMVNEATERAKKNTLRQQQVQVRDEDDWLEKRMASAPKRPVHKNQERCQTPIPMATPVEALKMKQKKKSRSKKIQPRPTTATTVPGNNKSSLMMTSIGEEKVLKDRKQALWRKKHKSSFVPDDY